ncbi:hypothetical protein [Xanthobacter versatilis]|uniref:hypothetical protein n=1 Tax=Xanthobacter autotrophicus (strain ATCC BAA-1158 / Py2) TaxID=78245 RepID=UPI00372BB0BF
MAKVTHEQRAAKVYSDWDAAGLVRTYGRGYGEDLEPGVDLLKEITQPRSPFVNGKVDMLDYLLAHMPPEWDPKNRACFAGSLLRYMAHLD